MALLKTIFAQEGAEAAQEQWNIVSAAPRERYPALAATMDESRDDEHAYMGFPREQWAQFAAINPFERLNGEIKRRSDVVGIFPNDKTIVRLVSLLMHEHNDEWAVCRRYMTLEGLKPVSDDPPAKLPAVAARTYFGPHRRSALLHRSRGRHLATPITPALRR